MADERPLRMHVLVAFDVPSAPEAWGPGATEDNVLDRAREHYLNGDGTLTGEGVEALILVLNDGDTSNSTDRACIHADGDVLTDLFTLLP